MYLCDRIITKESTLNKIKHIISGLLWVLVSIVVCFIVLLHLPPVQSVLGSSISTALEQKLGTKVQVGKVDVGFLNRAIVDRVMIYDQQGDSMIYATRVSAKIDLLSLFQGKISITSAQLFGLKAQLYKQTAQSKPNFQFILDSLASKDTTKHTPLNLHIGSLIIRHGNINYDQRDVSSTYGRFSPKHIHLNNLSTHTIINHLTDNNIDLFIKKLSFKDQSGLELHKLSFKFTADKQEAWLKEAELQLPNTNISLGDLHVLYSLSNEKIDLSSLIYSGSILQSKLTLADIACFVPTFRNFDDAIFLNCSFTGKGTSLHCPSLNFRLSSGNINLQASGHVSDWNKQPRWNANIENLNITNAGIKYLLENIAKLKSAPQQVLNLGTINYKGNLVGHASNLSSRGIIETEVGGVSIKIQKRDMDIQAHIETEGINLGHILDKHNLGTLAMEIDMNTHGKERISAKGQINQIDYNSYRFKNISLDGNYSNKNIEGYISIEDPNAQANVEGAYNLTSKKYDLSVQIKHLMTSILGIKVKDPSYCIDDINVMAKNDGKDSYFDLQAPFAEIHVDGQYDYTSISKSITNLIGSKLSTLPGLPKIDNSINNNFSLRAYITSTEVLQKVLGIPLSLQSPLSIKGSLSDNHRDINIDVSLPAFTYGEMAFNSGNVLIKNFSDSLMIEAGINQGSREQRGPSYQLHASAANNILSTVIKYHNRSKSLPIRGLLEAQTRCFKNEQGVTTTHIEVQPSLFVIGSTPWEVHPAEITYQKNHLTIDHFTISHGSQHISINGEATSNPQDSIIAELKDVDVAYILNLVNFHSVEFEGLASGQAVIKSLFHNPDAYAQLDVKKFTFETGALGTLHANVNYDKEGGQINIDAIAEDGIEHQTLINGYVSPKRNYIDLAIKAKETSMEFMRSFCGSFMEKIQAWCNGKMNIVGPLNNINLIGDISAHGKMHMIQLNTDYSFNNLRAHAIPNEIMLLGDSLYDRNYNHALVSGGIHHKHLTQLSFDIDVNANNFLSYDTHQFDENTFYGTIYGTGKCSIHGKSGETVIDISAMPEANSIFVYNAASPDAISDESFIHWGNQYDKLKAAQDSSHTKLATTVTNNNDIDIPSDMRINFLINGNQNLTLRLMMDEQTGDYIDLNGDGVLRANYFNKGAFDMYGNYIVDHGVYKLTIQNLIKKEFEFMPGGTITFGGDPYNAPINLQAKYTVNGVPLSDLNIGRSFSSNNIRVDCLMDITGTPGAPKVSFSMDMPTVNTDAKQMIYSLINSQEEMNQQVLYLLGIGRFYAQGKNNQASENVAQQSQTSLAMQSFLSGTVSQQINTVLSSLINNNNWNFGANISTGDEGFNNAEYEGILSGRMLNNRLLFNGQFGYRDNANATQSFIGDFDLRYLIYPNGNLQFRMYNQTNDRYFTRNSLNTQGIGLIMKKDFNNFWDLFRTKKKNK